MDTKAIEMLYTQPGDASVDNRGVSGYMTRTTRAGRQLDIDVYPIIKNRDVQRAMRTEAQRAAQERVNARARLRRVEGLLNANFDENDLWVTLTYRGECPGHERARKDVRNFLDRVKRLRKKRGLPELKYLGTIECADGEGEQVRLHHHIVMSGGLDRDEVEALWHEGYAQTRRLMPDPEAGLEGMARYIVKGERAHEMKRKPGVTRWRTWTCSRNLTEPNVTVSRHRISRRRVERLALELPGVAKEVFEKLYPGYCFVKMDVRMAGGFPGAYIYARMRKIA